MVLVTADLLQDLLAVVALLTLVLQVELRHRMRLIILEVEVVDLVIYQDLVEKDVLCLGIRHYNLRLYDIIFLLCLEVKKRINLFLIV